MSSTGSISISALNALLEKSSDWDKDERYMATNDLCSVLSKNLKIDENMEQRICVAVLKQLDDQSNDVQSVAVKCLAILVKKVQKAQIGNICTKLCTLIIDGTDALRDVYSIGLKNLIADVPDSMGLLVCENITGRLLLGISKTGKDEVQRECLDNMSDLLHRFGHLNEDSHQSIMKSVVQQLQSERTVIRKRAAQCLGSLAVVSSDALLNDLVQQVLGRIEDTQSQDLAQHDMRTLIQTIGTISRTVGFRLGRHLPRIVPLFLRFCGDPADEEQQTDAVNDLRETCFPGLESFVLRCPKEVSPFLPEILRVSVAFMRYDPNYAYDDEGEDGDRGEGGAAAMDTGYGEQGEEEEDGEQEDAVEEEEYEEEDYGGSDDDDTSWKVRKAAVKVIGAAVQARPDQLQDLFQQCGLPLVRRFKEREENVRLDIIKCFGSLLQTATPSSSSSSSRLLLPQLQGSVGLIVAECCAQLQGSSVKAKSALFGLLCSLVAALNGGLDKYLPKLLRLTEKCLSDRQQTLKLDALTFLRAALRYHPASALQPALPRLVELVIKVAQEDWYKVIAEALRTLSALVPALRPIDMGVDRDACCSASVGPNAFVANTVSTPEQVGAMLLRIYSEAVQPRLEALDIDQQIKECAIAAAGSLFLHGGDMLSAQLRPLLQTLRKRLENETTRAATLRALGTIALGPARLDFSAFLVENAAALALFLRQSSRLLKQLTLQTLGDLMLGGRTAVTPQVVDVVLQEVAALVCDADLHLSHLALVLVLGLVQKDAYSTADAMHAHGYGKLLLLARSPLIQGASQEALINLFRALAAANLPRMTSADMFQQLYSTKMPIDTCSGGNGGGRVLTAASPASSGTSSGELSKQALSCLSKCIAGVVTSSADPGTVDAAISRFNADLQQATASDAQMQLALLCLGEAGQERDLSAIASLRDTLLRCFDSPCEDTKLSAAYALGHIAVGSLDVFLPVVLQSAGANNRQKYLLLAALKEVVVVFAQRRMDFLPHLPAVLPVLLEQCRTAEEESVRTMVAECVGVLTCELSQQLLPVLLQLLDESAPGATVGEGEGEGDGGKLSRRMVAHALRVSLSRPLAAPAQAALSGAMGRALTLLGDTDLEVKRAALLMVNTAVHRYPRAVEDHVATAVVPVLVETLKVKMERVVDLGPFKHRVDDNLPLRKAALTCVETLLDSMPQQLDVAAFLQVLPLLLADKDEIKSQAHQILCRLCAYAPGVVVGHVDQLVGPLGKTVGKRPSKDAGAGGAAGGGGGGGPEAERALDLVRSGLRAVLAVGRIEDVAQISRSWADFSEKVRRDEYTAALLQAIESERASEAH